MGKVTGFLQYERRDADEEDPRARLEHFSEFKERVALEVLREQGARCMSCGVPFCHSGCPLGNRIPDWNDHVYRGRWAEAWAALESTNNFPEVTGRVCPAPCEASCVLAISDEPVTIETIEKEIADRAWDEGWVRPRRAAERTTSRVAVVGSGPAGLACAQQLARAGHDVTVLERADRIGGLLRYGIPDFKLDKAWIDRRIGQMREEGVSFRTGVTVGRDVSVEALRATHDAVVLATGATVPRDLAIEGRELLGIHPAVDFLTQQNRRVAGDDEAAIGEPILATAKRVVILGGGDTGSDCLGTSLRQGASSVVQIELMPRPPDARDAEPVWPYWPMVMRTSSSQAEGGEREFAVMTRRFVGDDGGRVCGLEAVRLARAPSGRLEPIEGSEHVIDCDLVLLAMGFTGPAPRAWAGTELSTDGRGNLLADVERFATSERGVFACGDARRGQSLVVWAIWEGRQTAVAVDAFLTGQRSVLASSPIAHGF
ncbi:MAG: glutamate synthase subunit beta [Sandaracinaceae bacterium]